MTVYNEQPLKWQLMWLFQYQLPWFPWSWAQLKSNQALGMLIQFRPPHAKRRFILQLPAHPRRLTDLSFSRKNRLFQSEGRRPR